MTRGLASVGGAHARPGGSPGGARRAGACPARSVAARAGRAGGRPGSCRVPGRRAAALLTQRSAEQAAAAVLVGVPKASRLARESFASTMGTLLAARRVLPARPVGVAALGPPRHRGARWRGLARATAVGPRGAGSASAWSDRRCWRASQDLLTRAADRTPGAPGVTTLPPSGEALRLLPSEGIARDGSGRSDARWHST